MTGQEEDKQSLAYVFAATLKSERRRARATDELTFAMDTGQEKPIAFRAVAERAAQDLVKRLP